MDVSSLGESLWARWEGLVEGTVVLGRGVVYVSCCVCGCLHIV